MSARVQVVDLTGADLDYWVARARGTPAEHLRIETVPRTDNRICVNASGPIPARFDPSTNWAIGGPIIERERIHVAPISRRESLGDLAGKWTACIHAAPVRPAVQFGESALAAAMRAYVASVYGATVGAAP
ncbi:hypothetical protein CR152_27820 [Massilia violaceinigra]|uniref:DUF2591 domain-containing protein n=1 Tax=Massilia violaceinigra TaxID=2045208 RepID=A0A2D2DSD2_9BURK|nr:hypothetical protein CR152_27820 [Massilia violaceinigra]